MLDNVGVNTTEETVAPAATVPSAPTLSPLDDPEVWRRFPMFRAPADIDAERCQRDVDGIYGVTRNNQPILKLVWSGDREYWRQMYLRWDAEGEPVGGVQRRPLVRFEVVKDQYGRYLRDVFPPRWLILTRLEPEQYPNWREESFVVDGYTGLRIATRPITPPPVYWLWWATIAHHTDHCCTAADAKGYRCYGQYAPPSVMYDQIGLQKKADDESGLHNPFEMVDFTAALEIEEHWNGYQREIDKLTKQREVALEAPIGFLGPVATIHAGVSSLPQARSLVNEFFDRREDELADQFAKQRMEEINNRL